MKLSVKGIALTSAILWGGCILLTGTLNRIWPSYGLTCLQVVDSIYPGYHAGSGFINVLVGTLYGLLDGAIGGFLFAWLYNLLTSKPG